MFKQAPTSITWGGRIYDLEREDEMKAFVTMVFRTVLKFPRPLPSVRSVAIVALGVSSLILVCSSALSVFLNDWLWFARSGSLCIVVGTLLIFYDISGYYEDSLAAVARLNQFLATGMDVLQQRVANEEKLSEEQKQKMLMRFEEMTRNFNAPESTITNFDIRQEARMQDGKVRFVEATLFVIGTIVWGFGDLIGSILKTLQ